MVAIKVEAGVVGADGGAASTGVAVSEAEGEEEVGEVAAEAEDEDADFVDEGAAVDVGAVSVVEVIIIMVVLAASTTTAITTHNLNLSTTPRILYPLAMSIGLSKLKLGLLPRLLEKAARIFT